MEIFKFDKEKVLNHIRYELKTIDKVAEPLNYIFKTLEKKGHSLTLKTLKDKINLKKIKPNKGKNYDWAVINYENVKMLIRIYRHHLTIFTKVTKKCELRGTEKNELTAFTFRSDLKYFKGDVHDTISEQLYENPFLDLNKCIKQMFEVIIERGAYWVQNSACLKVPEHVEITLAFDREQIYGVDNFIFCMEEIDSIFGQLFSENTMLKKLSDLKNRIGEDFDYQYTIKEVETKVKDGYYHGVGLLLEDKKDKKESFKDVYCLTGWYLKNVFKDKIYFYDGEVYVQGGEFKVGEPVTYKKDFDDTFLFQEKYLKENLIPLIKY